MPSFASKLCLVVVLILSCVSQSYADIPAEHVIVQRVIRSATAYAQSVACDTRPIHPRDVVALVPYLRDDPGALARYAVLWVGDLGCSGGSHSTVTNLSIVQSGIAQTFQVDPRQSSPVIQFVSPVRIIDRVVSHSEHALEVEGYALQSTDASCCPSKRIRFKLTEDFNGNWR